jgi:hypothetical protein
MTYLIYMGYCSLIRLDRLDGRRSGGVAMYVSSEFVPSRGCDLELSDYEMLWVEIKIKSITLVYAGLVIGPMH